MEEIRQLTEFGAVGPVQILLNIVNYYISNWNSIDWLMMWTFYIGLTLRLTLNEDDFYIARIVYCISLILMYFRLLQFATIWEYLGPKVSMIKIMMTRDLPPFLIVFFVFFISFGVVYHALLYPNDILNREMVAQVLAMPYWQLYGELQLEKIEGEGEVGCTHNATLASTNPDIPRCPETENYPWLVPILAGLYMIVSNILLLNLLIAVFNQTYTYVEEESSKVHRFNQYSLVEEYLGRPILPPPLNMLEILIFRPVATLLISCFWCCRHKEYRCRPHCCNLFKLLMVEKEVDPDLWDRSIAGPRCFKYDNTVKEYIEMKQQELDASAVASSVYAGGQSQRNDDVAQQINTFQQKLQAADHKIEKLQNSIDKIEERVVDRILENQRDMFTMLLNQYSERQSDDFRILQRTMSSTSQRSLMNPETSDDIMAELQDIKESTKSAWTRLSNSVKKNRKILKTVVEETEKRQRRAEKEVAQRADSE
ncbi:transient receptor potential cation channel subfamily M member 3-like [Glandiceps talaboti]